VVLAGSLAFPEGQAATSRARLLSLALVERGHQVTVLATRVSEDPSSPRNVEERGEWRGVRFLYSTGTTMRDPRFAVRRWVELRGSIKAMTWLVVRKLRSEVDCVVLLNEKRWTVWGAVMRLFLRVARIPWVLELCELPWTQRADRRFVEKHTSPLDGAAGAVCISVFLEQWAREWAEAHEKSVELRRVPIVVDAGEFERIPEARRPDTPQVLLAAGPGYRDELQLVLRAMEVVWQRRPDCRLMITGWSVGGPGTGPAFSLVRGASRPHGVVLAGYVPRARLLSMYAECSALLAPLVPGDSSCARFPTKIAEYLVSGRPVVITSIGEPARLLADGQNAFVAPSPDPAAYGDAILEALQDMDRATAVGSNGRRFASDEFDYSRWGECLEELLTTCSGRVQPNPDAGKAG